MREQAGRVPPARGSNAPILEGDLLGVLSARVANLVERFHEAQRRIAELDAQVTERDRSVSKLMRDQEDAKRRRNDASKRIGRLITQVERLEQEGR